MSEVMESVSGKASDANRKLDEINELLEEFYSVQDRGKDGYLGMLDDISVKIVIPLRK